MLKVLLNLQRRRILLTFGPGERLNAMQVASVAKLSRTAVSHHLKILRQAGALESAKIGKEVHFWINRDNIAQVIRRILAYVQNKSKGSSC